METIIWPVYINSKLSRKEGRKIKKEIAVSDPKLTEMSRAARKLNMNPKTEDDKSYPSSWWENSGRIIVSTENISKNNILIKISETIKTLRQK
ncbi:signal recognition particle protein Srp19 [Methanobrevibacter cuticularis]|uniref:Signal recognition particle 19 kDa protein n=1 Tax=Methanobrevibacter cuticularis TaxID=47311 RepID=A0A166DY15_9EURY|nr:signal recognition particle subunit SRP19/SEC65 family protein [Methanobrevibacter cuticularis]KZX16073.1 signal recognition particle protein Srp19 [Methanobrevibacter cuticularis]